VTRKRGRGEEQNREEGEMAQKSWEEGEIGGKSREEGDLLPCSSPLQEYFSMQVRYREN